jgi:hypothetical protein
VCTLGRTKGGRASTVSVELKKDAKTKYVMATTLLCPVWLSSFGVNTNLSFLI